MAAGDFTVRLTAFNDEHPAGVSTSILVRVVEAMHYVAITSTNPVTPYACWATAARTIQQAVNAAKVPGARVLVSNGVYATGGKAVHGTITNRVAITKPIRVESVNGPAVTLIQGYQVPTTTNGSGAVRCVYLTNGAVLAGFTLTNGATQASAEPGRDQSGGGAWCESVHAMITNCTFTRNSASSGGGASGGTLDHCTLRNNSAVSGGGGAYGSTLNHCTLLSNSAGLGGGAERSTLNHCTLAGNIARAEGGGDYQGLLYDCILWNNSAFYGGGVSQSTLNNCTLTSNSSDLGGGAYRSMLNNCILYDNTANWDPNYVPAYDGTINYCCTTPLPSSGSGNISAPPLFVDRLRGNLRLQSNSPCINAGLNAFVFASTDLDGRPRIVGGTVDIGAYEFQGPGFSQFIPWLARFGLPTDGSADYADSDKDGLNNWQEWTADAIPTNALSCLRIVRISAGPPVSIAVQTSAARLYTLCHSTNATDGPWLPVPGATDIPGNWALQTLVDPTAGATRFYRVSVRLP